MNFHVRNGITISTADYECLWIEIHSNLNVNLICGVLYRHPNNNLDAFLAYVSETANKINCKNKYCIIMGDFNIDLLNSDSHTGTDEYLNILGSYFFTSHIIQPTRITQHSGTYVFIIIQLVVI